MQHRLRLGAVVFSAAIALLSAPVIAQSNTDSDPVGVGGTIPTAAPTSVPTIAVPATGQTFTESRITVSGVCETDLLIKLFKNNVFGGSVVCQNGSYQIDTDLFAGENVLYVQGFDDLDQGSPRSNEVTLNYTGVTVNQADQLITLTSGFAKRGANPGELLTWPIALSGGTGPYAISIDWGDGTEPQLLTQTFAGDFDISHIYSTAGIYQVVVRATAENGSAAYLQLTAVANGAITDTADQQDVQQVVVREYIWWPLATIAVLVPLGYWLGRKSMLHALRKRNDRPY